MSVTNANHKRAGNGLEPTRAPKRHYWSWLHRTLAVLRGWSFYADVSYFQVLFDGSYRRPIFCCRLDSGYGTDSNAATNVARARKSQRVKLIVGYVVYRPGEEVAIFNRVKALLGPVCPLNVVFRIDMESGLPYFAGPGDHSDGANRLFAMLADYRRTAVGNHPYRAAAGVDGYANGGDWTQCWPNHPADLKRNLAAYTATKQDFTVWYGQQYAGGDPRWGSPAGWPRSFSPFGAIDCNVIPRRIGQVLFDYGVTMTNRPGVDGPPHKRRRPIRPGTGKTHRVEAGDSLSSIAQHYNTTPEALVHLNRRAYPSLVKNPDRIQIGWVLKVSAR